MGIATAEINAALWELAKNLFAQYENYEIDENAKTISLTADETTILLQHFTRKQNRPYKSLKKYGIGEKFKPQHGKIIGRQTNYQPTTRHFIVRVTSA